jgi:hypothetical protein
MGIPTFVIEEVPIESRDFTQGKAKALLMELKSKGAVSVKNQNELLALLNVSAEKLKMPKEVSPRIPGHLKLEELPKEKDITSAGDNT